MEQMEQQISTGLNCFWQISICSSPTLMPWASLSITPWYRLLWTALDSAGFHWVSVFREVQIPLPDHSRCVSTGGSVLNAQSQQATISRWQPIYCSVKAIKMYYVYLCNFASMRGRESPSNEHSWTKTICSVGAVHDLFVIILPKQGIGKSHGLWE